MIIEASFTNNGVPSTGLSPTIRIRELPNTLVITDKAMSEVGEGTYYYDYTDYDVTKDYAIRCDGTNVLNDSDRYKFAGNENYYDDVANAVWSDPLSGYGQDSAGNLLKRIHTATEVRQAQVTDSASSTKFETNLIETTNNFWERASFLFTTGNNTGQTRGIRSYNGTTKEIEIETPLSFVPVSGDNFIITSNRKFLSPENYQNVIYYDQDNGNAGTEYPVGLYEYPVNNLTDALIIADDRNIDIISIRSDMTIGAIHNVGGMSIETHGIMGTDILFSAGCSANNTTVKYANVSGELTNGDVLLFESCSISNLANFSGIMNVVTFCQGCEISIGNWANLISCHAGGDPGNEPEINIGTGSVNINKYTGNLKLTGKTGIDRTVANFQSGNVIVDSTCVSGTIQILGVGQVEKDESGSNCKIDVDSALTNNYIADHIWDENTSGHLADGTFGNLTQRMAGLLHHNIYIDNPIYDGDGNLTSAKVRVYSNSSSVGSDNDVIGTYEITAPGSGPGKFTSWKQIEV